MLWGVEVQVGLTRSDSVLANSFFVEFGVDVTDVDCVVVNDTRQVVYSLTVGVKVAAIVADVDDEVHSFATSQTDCVSELKISARM